MTVSYEINLKDVSHNSFDGEVIVVNLSTGSYFSLHDTAAEIWQLLAHGPGSTASIRAAFDNVGMSATAEIENFLQQLAEQKLILPCGLPATVVKSTKTYAPPVLDAFDELRELLLADIIHDTDEQGWPHVAPPPAATDSRAA